ncbi:MAG: bifunctional 4-hydroxy-2-oxoglutarate aldolase/2-dehydro-3-deoxy-phosphogluconate aldolase [Candidatus Dadabacteria bacterium]|nr:bifunctional 4-hydroxy-2-oxoglutarate aldolase/2-dehydro-3-deoxy-phosphogluconate aldolase [Candidatus Dadabacteria bacterium]
MSLMKAVEAHRVFAVIRAEEPGRAMECALACIEGGIRLIEVTFSFDGAEGVIGELSKRGEAHIGAGTVLNVDLAKIAASRGAEFIVSPHTDKDIISFSKSKDLLVVSGAFTSNEIVQAWDLGADMVKVFPVAQAGGPAYIKAIKDPLPFIPIIATGGVNNSNLLEYIDMGATAVGLWSSLFGSDGGASPEDIRENAKRAVERVNWLRG